MKIQHPPSRCGWLGPDPETDRGGPKGPFFFGARTSSHLLIQIKTLVAHPPEYEAARKK
jgi:hypothetical protein